MASKNLQVETRMKAFFSSRESCLSQLHLKASSMVLIVLLLLMTYVVSVGPVFKIATINHGLISDRLLRTLYRPVVLIAPEASSLYLNLWGVSDIEVFFAMQSSRREP
jgi:hypothetical protein